MCEEYRIHYINKVRGSYYYWILGPVKRPSIDAIAYYPDFYMERDCAF